MSYEQIAVLIILFWVIIFGYYFLLTRKQNQLQISIEQLRDRLDKEDA